jgi:hypothetical protein
MPFGTSQSKGKLIFSVIVYSSQRDQVLDHFQMPPLTGSLERLF